MSNVSVNVLSHRIFIAVVALFSPFSYANDVYLIGHDTSTSVNEFRALTQAGAVIDSVLMPNGVNLPQGFETIAIGPGGRVYLPALDATNPQQFVTTSIAQFDAAGAFDGYFVAGSDMNFSDISTRANGEVYIVGTVNAASGWAYRRYSSAGALLDSVAIPDGPGVALNIGAERIAVAPNGHVYLPALDPNNPQQGLVTSIAHFDDTGNFVDYLVSEPGSSGFGDVSIRANGDIYVTASDGLGGLTYRSYRPDGSLLNSVPIPAGVFAVSGAIAVAPNGHVFIPALDPNSPQQFVRTSVAHFDEAGNFVDYITTGSDLSFSDIDVLEGSLADLDFDGDVDDADFGLAFAAFTGPGNGPPGNPSADLDFDGDVDDADFGLAFAAFTGPASAVNVPEPGASCLLGLVWFAGTRRRHGG